MLHTNYWKIIHSHSPSSTAPEQCKQQPAGILAGGTAAAAGPSSPPPPQEEEASSVVGGHRGEQRFHPRRVLLRPQWLHPHPHPDALRGQDHHVLHGGRNQAVSWVI